MVLLECAAGKSAIAALNVVVKTSSLGGRSAAVPALLGPAALGHADQFSHALDAANAWGQGAFSAVELGRSAASKTACLSPLKIFSGGISLAYKAVSTLGTCVRAVDTPAAAVGFGLILHRWWEFEEGEDESNGSEGSPMMRMTAHFMKFTVVHDSFMAGLLVKSIGLPLEAHLRTWVVGGLILSLPASYLVQVLTNRYGIRTAFGAECLLSAASFLWLSAGLDLLNRHPHLMHQAPLLFWSCFVSCLGSWTVLSFSIVATILVSCAAVFGQAMANK